MNIIQWRPKDLHQRKKIYYKYKFLAIQVLSMTGGGKEIDKNRKLELLKYINLV